MIRTTVNLSRHPAENLRRIRLLWGGGLALLLVLFVVLAAAAAVGWFGSRQIQAETAAVHARMGPLLVEQARDQAPLRDPKVQLVIQRSRFLNQLIDRKSISWTLLFERLEQITPPGVELLSLRPQERNGAHAVDIRFASQTLDPAIGFVRALEASDDFAAAQVVRETETVPSANAAPGVARTNSNAEPRFQIEITALYQPRLGQPPKPIPAPPSAGVQP
ncbi:MAG: hypothetical protein ACRD01_03760 [Terriglobales bacterium]